MISKVIQFVFGSFTLFLSFLIGKVECNVFNIMMDMLRSGLELSAYNVTILCSLAWLFITILFILLAPLMMGIYLVLDVFNIDITQ